MATTFVIIANYTANGNPGAIDFTSIPQTYDALALFINARSSRSSYADDVKMIINNNASISCNNIRGYGTAGSAISQDGGNSTSNNFIGISNALTDQQFMFGPNEYYFPNYSNTTLKKSIVCTGGSTINNANAYQQAWGAATFQTTNAITQITLSGYNDTSNTWIQDSTFYLYGIKNT